ncbi:hypothetical protein [Niallia oryzisoli]|uniref:hypothetical protein n=1 Tax=Niallia oryzisoli TaxID=1737571 RepID=UPI00373552F7
MTWEPKVIIQIIKGNRTVRLEENFNDFNRYQGTELLLIQLYHGATLLKVIGLYIDYLWDEQHWIVRSMSNDPLAAWRRYS